MITQPACFLHARVVPSMNPGPAAIGRAGKHLVLGISWVYEVKLVSARNTVDPVSLVIRRWYLKQRLMFWLGHVLHRSVHEDAWRGPGVVALKKIPGAWL